MTFVGMVTTCTAGPNLHLWRYTSTAAALQADAKKEVVRALAAIEQHLQSHTFLVRLLHACSFICLYPPNTTTGATWPCQPLQSSWHLLGAAAAALSSCRWATP